MEGSERGGSWKPWLRGETFLDALHEVSIVLQYARPKTYCE